MQIKACIFDLDGVIVDTAKYHFDAWRRMANEVGFDFKEKENEKLKGVSRMGSLNLILEWAGIEKSEEEKQQLAFQKNEWYLEMVNEMNASETLPGVVDLLDTLDSRGIKIALGSASKNAELILKKIGLHDRFEAIVDGNKVIKGKPDPEVFQKGAAALGIDPKNCIVFEDAAKGIQAANAAGMFSVGIGNADVLSKANVVIPGFNNISFDEILEIMAATTNS